MCIASGGPALSAGESTDDDGRKRVCLLTGASGTLGSDFCARYADRYSISAVFRHHAPVAPSQDATFIDPLNPDAELAVNQHPIFTVQGDISIETDCERIVEAKARLETLEQELREVYARWEHLESLAEG